MARNRLVEVDTPLAISLFDRAIAHPVFAVASKYTIFAVDNRRYQIAVAIYVANPRLFDYSLCCRQKVVPNGGQNFFEFILFLSRNRSTGVALDTALAEASIKVATKELLYKVERNERVTDFEHNSMFCSIFCHLLTTLIGLLFMKALIFFAAIVIRRRRASIVAQAM